tara:strand:+ start:89 stop:763 length:675 start_codon:yes stop_codon:yes gene_type:complete
MFFEINNVFDAGDHVKYESIPNQVYSLSSVIPSKATHQDRREKPNINDIYYVKQLLINCFGNLQFKQIQKPGFHQNISYIILKNDFVIGHFGQLSTQLENFYELNNALYLFNIDLTNLDSSDLVSIIYQPLSPYPFVKFDLSFMVDTNFQGEKIINEVEKIFINNENVISIFDDFKNEKSRNLGIRINTRSYNKTYSEEEVSDLLNEVVKTLEDKFSIKLNKGS